MPEIQKVSYAAADLTEIHSYLALPAGGKRAPAVVVLRGVAGGDEGYTEIAARLASWGYAALVHGWPVRGANPPDSSVCADLDAALAFLRHLPTVDPDAVALMGFCRGGIYAFMGAALHRSVRVIVMFHGFAHRALDGERRLQPMDLAEAVTVPVLMLHGSDDKSAPLAGMRELQARLETLGGVSLLRVYDGAQHGFAVSTHPNFSGEPAAQAFAEARQFLGAHLGVA